MRALATDDVDVALEELEPHHTADEFLAVVDGDLQHLALGTPPEAVVDQLGVLRHERILEVRDFTVEGDRLDRPVGPQHDGAARGLIGATTLHADEAVLDDVETTDAVLTAETVELGEDFGRSHGLTVDGDDVALFVGEVEIGGLVGRHFRTHRPAPHLRRWLGERIFQRATLKRDVEQVGVHRER